MEKIRLSVPCPPHGDEKAYLADGQEESSYHGNAVEDVRVRIEVFSAHECCK